MQRFAELYYRLDATTRTSEKLRALQDYFEGAPARDAAWVLAILSGGKLIRAVSSRRLRDWVGEATGLPHWLIAESYDAVGDLSETMALLLPPVAHGTDRPLHEIIEDRLLPLPALSEREQRAIVMQTWQELDERQRYLYHKMILGSMRVGVAARLVVRALANVADVDPAIMAHRLTGQWTPGEEAFERLMRGEDGGSDPAKPYPFCLAYPLEGDPHDLGDVGNWQAEWKWDGIRAQIIRRAGQTLVWSRGDELIAGGFPEVRAEGDRLPDGTVLDGEILAWEDDHPLPFILLQRRINRKREEPRLWDEVPLAFMVFDLLEEQGQDIRGEPLAERRRRLDALLGEACTSRVLRLSPAVVAASWDELGRVREQARERGAEGLMLKRLDSAYGVGRQRGSWWKWKVDPYSVDAVLMYAQLGNGKRASLFTDYAFGVWEGEELVPVAKAYSGLTDEEIHEVDRFVRRNTTGRFGPVRVVRPELVFELAFEAIQPSGRHKAGLALRFPRMARWRRDKTAREADTLESLRVLMRSREAVE